MADNSESRATRKLLFVYYLTVVVWMCWHRDSFKQNTNLNIGSAFFPYHSLKSAWRLGSHDRRCR